jgi:hypothetical protein
MGEEGEWDEEWKREIPLGGRASGRPSYEAVAEAETLQATRALCAHLTQPEVTINGGKSLNRGREGRCLGIGAVACSAPFGKGTGWRFGP